MSMFRWRYEGLSEKFLSCPVPKLLLLAGTDRLDRFDEFTFNHRNRSCIVCRIYFLCDISRSIILCTNCWWIHYLQAVRQMKFSHKMLHLVFWQSSHHRTDAREISDDSGQTHGTCYSGRCSRGICISNSELYFSQQNRSKWRWGNLFRLAA